MLMTLFVALIAQTVPAPAATPKPCEPLPPVLSVWADVHPLAHGFVVGRTVELTPVPVANVRLAVQPSRPLSSSHVATASFEVKAAGTYIVAVGGATAPVRPLWLDIAGADGKPLKSVAHGHGAACGSITKALDFQLASGKYTFLATGLTSARPVRVLIVSKS